MGTTTNAGLPYPEGTDLVMDGDNAIRALAQALDDKVVIPLSSSAYTATTPPSSYPVGISIIPLGTTEATAGGWPIASSSQVLTIVNPGSTVRAAQYQFRNSAAVTEAKYRNGSDQGWAPWMSGAAPYGSASGRVSVSTSSSSNTASTTITFPTNRFTESPAVVATGSNSLLNATASGATATSAVITIRRLDSADFSGSTQPVMWIAQQDTASLALLRSREAPAVQDATVTCPTPDCSNVDVPIPIASVWTDLDTDETYPVTEVVCGVCGADITDTMAPIEATS